jgi:hypothetical protein
MGSVRSDGVSMGFDWGFNETESVNDDFPTSHVPFLMPPPGENGSVGWQTVW